MPGLLALKNPKETLKDLIDFLIIKAFNKLLNTHVKIDVKKYLIFQDINHDFSHRLCLYG